MKRNLRSTAVGARKKALRRQHRERMRRACCEKCMGHIPGRLGRASRAAEAPFRPTARAVALRDQLINS
ncbi:hypothetical protein Achl_4366 (plasmid) [Pseudarthrobacter chlorophenolicus A6]|uniref:Uncharacterized protein n=1 Tax=Pseudarthrobacter chlorophenolicus (strain ATCC 700700 / DSM 12829 / CIP 107037 / JCM 12360 / KCTC 9906 / NCIMB 13794 / A6) TaxID=452863 RepID=B8HIS0_PSECP|nr:hypothetical protein [Pseudarthrobacter chlorophenolicus]ACL42317.1 hypothetical protein Achl_4366 [Pseudarthrobacter chlorophenolicus A6]SDQ16412.1 hypothetical protein SAMN04489738_0423 [Pseudarthrobacter chlorophenolicus]